MKIDIFDVEEFIKINNLREITSPVLFSRGVVPDPNGLISNEIFGIDIKSRRNTFAYIDLKGHFFHPHVYKLLKRSFKNIERIVNGSEYYSITNEGYLVKDDAGETGIDFLYSNWEKINWAYSDNPHSVRNERVSLLSNTKKDEIFMRYQIVIPAFYRDISPSSNGGGETDMLNTLYQREIRYASLLEDRGMFDFTYHATNYNMQSTIVEIYDEFKRKISKKNGMIKKFLMGKNVDYCTRSVISCPIYQSNKPEELQVHFNTAGVPLSQCCSLCYTYILSWLKNFFELNFIHNKNVIEYLSSNPDLKSTDLEIEDPEIYFSDKYIKEMIDKYIKDPECRFDPIKVPTNRGLKNIYFGGKKLNPDPNNKSELSNLRRPMTITDLLYMGCSEIIKNKHVMVTRYPCDDNYHIFFANITILTTLKTEPVHVNDTIYEFYPIIDTSIPKDRIAVEFIETLKFNNSYLKGMGGDYDGDQVTVKIIWSQDANEEVDKLINSKSIIVTPSGKNIKTIESEATQTFFNLTKNPTDKNRNIVGEDRDSIVKMHPNNITFKYLTDLFADKSIGNKVKESKFKPNDIIELKIGELGCKSITKTTIGRVIFNKLILEKIDAFGITGYCNEELTAKKFNALEAKLMDAMIADKISVSNIHTYLDTRDWLGLELHAVITPSFTPLISKIPPEVDKLKNELFKKYDKEIKAGDAKIAEKIEQELIAKTKEIFKDDPGLDLYISGARGSIENNLKNIILMRGAIQNIETGKFEIVKSSLMDGMEKNDIPTASDSIVLGAYPKSVATSDTGYLAKQLMAAMQNEIIDDSVEDCGTELTLTVSFNEKNKNEYIHRNIDDNGKVVLLNDDNISKYYNKKVNMYSPMFCKGEHICAKCAGKQLNKFIGLDTSKIANVLTNLNMKKFHDNVIHYKELNPSECLLKSEKHSTIFKSVGDNFVLNANYCEFYVPLDYFEKKYSFAEDMGDTIRVLGLFYVAVFENSRMKFMDTLNIPSFINITAGDSEIRTVDLPDGETKCRVFKYYKNSVLFQNSLIKDSVNCERFLRCITYGKLPGSIPYDKSVNIWMMNQSMNDISFGVPAIILEVVLSVMYRDKDNISNKFSVRLAKNPNSSMYDYKMVSVRTVCQYTSTFAGITFEDIDTMITTSINRTKNNVKEPESPIEFLLKL